MSLDPGTRLGSYEIVSPLGAGGMGEVYRARDTRLDRTVAIKVLASSLASDAQLRERFEREARAISALDHPNICALYDVGDQDGVAYLVMQYLEGDTLADRLSQGPLPVDQALRHAAEIADALSRAHRQGIVHRDLKPGNVVITKQGAKLLDFGLAKIGQALPGGHQVTALPTTPANLTAQGTILGTFQYMAPEQLEGKEADARTDIFAFGAMLFEMVTGRRAFEGKSQAGLISAIMSAEPPPVSSVQPTVPPSLDYVVSRCLAKDPDDRWQTARDLLAELNPSTRIGHERAIFRKAADGSGQEELLWSGTGHLHIGGYTPDGKRLVVATSGGGSGDIAVVALDTGKLTPMLSAPYGEYDAALSKDGRPEVFVRSFPSLEGRWQISTGGGSEPMWARDGKTLHFRGNGKIMAVDVTPGPPFAAGSPRPLFEDRFAATQNETHTCYDILPDGSLLMVQELAERQAIQHLTLVLHWRQPEVSPTEASR